MKICVYDKYDNPDHLFNVLRSLFNKLDSQNIQIGSMVIYATTWNKETGKSEEVVDEDGDKVAFEIGQFPFAEIEEMGENDNLVLVVPVKEGCEYSQEGYRQACFSFEKEKELATLLPIVRTSKAGNTKIYSTIDEIKKDNFSRFQILKAIKTASVFRNYKWSSEKFQKTLDKVSN